MCQPWLGNTCAHHLHLTQACYLHAYCQGRPQMEQFLTMDPYSWCTLTMAPLMGQRLHSYMEWCVLALPGCQLSHAMYHENAHSHSHTQVLPLAKLVQAILLELPVQQRKRLLPSIDLDLFGLVYNYFSLNIFYDRDVAQRSTLHNK